jgi:hypothetical protein
VFTIAERLTPHVRHRQKYVDVPVPDAQAFVFHPNGRLEDIAHGYVSSSWCLTIST